MKINVKNEEFLEYQFLDGTLFFRASCNYMGLGITIIHSINNSFETNKHPKLQKDEDRIYVKCLSYALKDLRL